MFKLFLVVLSLHVSHANASCADWIDQVKKGRKLLMKDLDTERLEALSGERVTIWSKPSSAVQAVVISARRSDPRKQETIYFRVYDLEERKIRRLDFVVQYKQLKSVWTYGPVPEMAALDASTLLPRLTLNPTVGNLDVITQGLDLSQPATVAYIDLKAGEVRTLSGRLIVPDAAARERAMLSGEPLLFGMHTGAGVKRFDQYGIIRVYGTKK